MKNQLHLHLQDELIREITETKRTLDDDFINKINVLAKECTLEFPKARISQNSNDFFYIWRLHSFWLLPSLSSSNALYLNNTIKKCETL